MLDIEELKESIDSKEKLLKSLKNYICPAFFFNIQALCCLNPSTKSLLEQNSVWIQ